MDKKLSLPTFLKLLTNNDIPVSRAMAVASKVFKEHNTPALLAQLDDLKLHALGIKDKDLRRLVLAAVRRAGYTESASVQPAPASGSRSTSTVQPFVAPKKKRKHSRDPSEVLLDAPLDEGSAYGNMDFNDVLDEEVLGVKSTVVNRAPLLTAWAMVVAERLGFEREEALSIGSVYTEMNAVAKGSSLGIIDQSRKKEAEAISGEQPYLDLMGRRPLYQTQSSKWRALASGSPALPSTAFSYISRALRQTTPYIVGALRLLAESYPPQELNKVGFSLYADFRPMVDGWGKSGEVRCEHILSLRKKEGRETPGTHASNSPYGGQEPIVEQPGPPQKRVRVDGCEAGSNEEKPGRLPQVAPNLRIR